MIIFIFLRSRLDAYTPLPSVEKVKPVYTPFWQIPLDANSRRTRSFRPQLPRSFREQRCTACNSRRTCSFWPQLPATAPGAGAGEAMKAESVSAARTRTATGMARILRKTVTCTASARAAILVHQFNEFKCSVEQPAIRGADPVPGHKSRVSFCRFPASTPMAGPSGLAQKGPSALRGGAGLHCTRLHWRRIHHPPPFSTTARRARLGRPRVKA